LRRRLRLKAARHRARPDSGAGPSSPPAQF
jgi:hypothetical protein